MISDSTATVVKFLAGVELAMFERRIYEENIDSYTLEVQKNSTSNQKFSFQKYYKTAKINIQKILVSWLLL